MDVAIILSVDENIFRLALRCLLFRVEF